MPQARPGLKDVAKRAGVGISSVSRVLSGHPDVSAGMRDRVMAAVTEIGYRPDIFARGLRGGPTMSVGLVIGDISNPLLSEISLGAEDALRRAGYSLLFVNSMNDPALEAQNILLFRDRHVDGLLLSLSAEDDADVLTALQTIEAPLVLIDRELDDPGEILRPSAVLCDHRGGMRAAISHLLDLGHRRIGCILGGHARFARMRRRGVEEAYAERGLPTGYSIVQGPLDAAHGQAATSRLLDMREQPTALVAGGNQLLKGCLRELRLRGLAVGTDLSLVSCDETDLTEMLDPPIAVVRRDTHQLGRTAAELLLRRIQDPDEGPVTSVQPTVFVPRPSCGPVREAAAT
ncbi:LacI family transcriptional regulator [Pseudonocardia kujensis]|uniref:LacI family DNA-binding transcriptional regulator n=1 Tax=Pseudonocardia kujensis TaxID=1128675 RepID=UPI001E40EB6A|nr:LacI family DNA-binding transcriptional regulator [Pseudonocardia kujensis]MCE0765536.1 LacI family transcriptional regulator [Pseudonocardia kujensis]